MASSKSPGDRPSFSAFLKKTKDKVRGIRRDESASPQGRGKAIAVSSESPDTSSGTSPPKSRKSLSANEKAKVRRAQVRRAQIQHRQRKAEYQKELELDITHYRELISLTEFEAGELRRQNDEIRALLASKGIAIPDSQCQLQRPTIAGQGDAWVDEILGTGGYDSGALTQSEGDMFADVNVDDIIVTLKKDDGMDTPFFSIRSNSASSNATNSPAAEGDSGLSQEEEQMVINFILSLEHICWDHFFLGDFPSHSYLSDDEAKGHTLMASSLCMAHAPQHVFLGRKLVSSASSCHKRRALGLDPVVPAVSFEWPSPAISLSSLHGLARSLNPGDKELTPIQAWFELAASFDKSVLLDPATLDLLSKELNGVVKCLEFGAVMEREAFKSVVGRVLGEGLEDVMAGVTLTQPDGQQTQSSENPFGLVGYAWA
ncbi:hypothetical protein FSOLCH5_007289 [Fusarium solani]|uniref:BZIP domain-containing protein n=1 Tax=Fusarium solani TaxID=169388 RepID=A0A9P9RBW5_FUSSL|nr:uncharacterized protein B0J15DRAFT_481649 [Fusarium solani]KAH7272380.1 hypothetical protein B0J15DRAFT_481649 [Fusarium solani]KAJ3468822.1 hypothetical protein MRS44_002887 [Fusarium solani]KAJ4235933.1 hypothetical protein NW759_001018 [Fusarium solani]